MFSFPLVVYKLVLNSYAKKYFQVLDFDYPVYLGSSRSRDQDSNKISTSHKHKNDKLSSRFQLEDHYKMLAKLTVFTNFTNFDIPLQIYDGLIKFKMVNEEKSNIDFNHEHMHYDILFSDGVLINSKKIVEFQLINFNPIDIKMENFELKKELDGNLALFENKFLVNTNVSIKFLRLQLLDNLTSSILELRNQNIDDCKKFIEIPAKSKLVAHLIIENTQKNSSFKYCSKSQYEDNSDGCLNLLSSHLYRYYLNVSTKFERKHLTIEFKILNGNIELLNESSEKLSKIIFSTNPSQVITYPVYIKSTHQTNLKIRSIEFTQFGRMFSFDWHQHAFNSTLSSHNLSENHDNHVNANATTLVGSLKVDSRIACKKECYLGLEPSSNKRGASTPPIIDLKSIDISNIDNLDEFDSSFLSNLWLKTIKNEASLKYPSNSKPQMTKAFNLDTKLLHLFKTRYQNLQRNEDAFQSKLKIDLEHEDSSSQYLGSLNEDKLHEIEPLSYSFDVKFKFTWPHFFPKNFLVSIEPTQIHVDHRVTELNITNPSNFTVMMQISLLNGVNELVSKNADLFSNSNMFSSKRRSSSSSSSSPTIFTASSAFTLLSPETPSSSSSINSHMPAETSPDSSNEDTMATAYGPPATPQPKVVTLSNSGLSSASSPVLLVTLGPHQAASIQVKFRPDELGMHENVLILRNNLTILDAYLIVAEAGSAELRIEDHEPAKTSVLFHAKLSPAAFNNFKLADMSKLDIAMSESDFELCKSDFVLPASWFDKPANVGARSSDDYETQYTRIQTINAQTNIESTDYYIIPSNHVLADLRLELLALDSIPPNHPVYFERIHQFSTSYRNKDGLFLRSLFEMKNIGNTHLVVYQTLFDGEICFSQGMRAAYCHSFSIAPYESAFLDIRYQPDFRQNLVSKRLTLVTNLGDLDYTINVHIADHMMSQCHDMMMRPPFETLFYYLAFIVSFGFASFLLVMAYYESRWLIHIEQINSTTKRAMVNAKLATINSNEESPSPSLQDICVEYHIHLVNKPVNLVATNGGTRPATVVSATSTAVEKTAMAAGKTRLKSSETKYKSKLNSRLLPKTASFQQKSNDSVILISKEKQISPPLSPSSKKKTKECKEKVKDMSDSATSSIVPSTINKYECSEPKEQQAMNTTTRNGIQSESMVCSLSLSSSDYSPTSKDRNLNGNKRHEMPNIQTTLSTNTDNNFMMHNDIKMLLRKQSSRGNAITATMTTTATTLPPLTQQVTQSPQLSKSTTSTAVYSPPSSTLSSIDSSSGNSGSGGSNEQPQSVNHVSSTIRQNKSRQQSDAVVVQKKNAVSSNSTFNSQEPNQQQSNKFKSDVPSSINLNKSSLTNNKQFIVRNQYRPITKINQSLERSQSPDEPVSLRAYKPDLFSFISSSLNMAAQNRKNASPPNSHESNANMKSNQRHEENESVWKMMSNNPCHVAQAQHSTSNNRSNNTIMTMAMDDLEQLNAQFRQLQQQNQQLKQLSYLTACPPSVFSDLLSSSNTNASHITPAEFSLSQPSSASHFLNPSPRSNHNEEFISSDDKFLTMSLVDSNENLSQQLSRSLLKLLSTKRSNSDIMETTSHQLQSQTKSKSKSKSTTIDIDICENEETGDYYEDESDENLDEYNNDYDNGNDDEDDENEASHLEANELLSELSLHSSRRNTNKKRNKRVSSPTTIESDVWLQPTETENDNDAFSVNPQKNNINDDYEQMVLETEKFERNFIQGNHNQPSRISSTSGTKKTDSMTTGKHRLLGPIRRPLRSTGNSSNHYHNHHNHNHQQQHQQQQQQQLTIAERSQLNAESTSACTRTIATLTATSSENTTMSTTNNRLWSSKPCNEFALFDNYKLFDDTPSKTNTQIDSILKNSLWSYLSTQQQQQQQPWNSVLLLNDCDLSESASFSSTTTPLTSLTSTDYNRIKSLWSNSNENKTT